MILDLYAGAGGWDEGARRLGLRTVGLAPATRGSAATSPLAAAVIAQAAGLTTTHLSVAA